ncbi:hypothetical protein [Sorangium cellulosum]|uniref:Uncharacterized protein n=1 Tax=Sorangium cellulosum TaxID=56 RepID=A0A150QR78_SORCE|nr:hypothetical protein [Sorangium cellulosum]KYF70454.1 hypothetical protein BE15_14395 [Sorangium cellulosum]
MQITLARARLRRALFAALAAVAGAGLAVEVLQPILHLQNRSGVVPLLSLSYEQNVPTWYTSSLLLACSLTLAAIAAGARRAGGFVKHWWGLCAAFLYISLDEVVEIHEAASSWIELGGVLYFSWVIPAAVVVAAFALAYLRFLARLPRDTRNRFLLAGGIYVTGALVLELPLGYWTEQAGSDNLVYGLIDFVEESMEMLGVNLFLLSLVDHLGAQGWTIGFSQAAPEPRPAAVERSA